MTASTSKSRRNFTAQRLKWRDVSLGTIDLDNGRKMRLTLGLGSGLSQRPGDPKGTVWAVADRGPNIKIKPAIKRYGLGHLRSLEKIAGAKIMSRPEIGPMICDLSLNDTSVRLLRQIPLRGASGMIGICRIVGANAAELVSLAGVLKPQPPSFAPAWINNQE